ncbi:DUF5063 domain-containing protein [Solemya velesiana gill symbiont]|uniref:DUF5063 domain-containing protein n=1 Tax=Solemya velesiana gill symbiont TaxID=1918948 RepID=A0A1T2KXS5_9GAMM|nr:DUF5063 domain-containing protein [Solemya velesiana gill symbiont]OOZ37643.1 DUF5063 domain-containing protein [Solemya velesiana gill symbiont]
MSPHFNEMAEIAQKYCTLIENADEKDPQWLSKVASLLPRLHMAISVLAASAGESGNGVHPDLDARFEIFARLREVLGNKDAYWMEFDVAQDGQHMSGSLADDLTDIYCELKYGLEMLEQEPSQALAGWCSGYSAYWGQHLLDAERHIYALKTRNQF